ncbi:MAG TPA: penicillin-binding protein 2, partial [Nitrospira sp.]|nr:penicillin-binding protein 2 [Nitrospira sp.]
DALGHEKRATVVDRPQAGNDLYLTIDARLQKVAEDLLGEEHGAIVALDPTSGDILAMASRPGFDPNVLSRELTAKQWVEIVQDEGRPLNNRASQGQYPPGSTFKIPMAIAALETKTMSPSSTVFCNGGYQFGKR